MQKVLEKILEELTELKEGQVALSMDVDTLKEKGKLLSQWTLAL